MKIIYLRTSTKEQTPELQLKDIQSIEPGDATVFMDKQSAWKDNIERGDFEKVKLLIRHNKVSDLYVWDLDRIYRNRKRLVEFFQFCKIYTCKVHSYRQRWLEDINSIPEPFNEIMHSLMLQIMGWIAEEESSKKSQRIKMAVRKEEGKKTTSHKGNKWGRKQISTQKVNIIKKLRHEGKSIRQIAKALNVSVGVVHKIITQIKVQKP